MQQPALGGVYRAHFVPAAVDSPPVAVLRCKMKTLFVVVLLLVTLISQSTAQLSCKGQ